MDNDPTVLYIFVGRGNFMPVPDKTRGDKRFSTTCLGPERVTDENVWVVTACSSYLYSMKVGTAPVCSFDCKVAEGLYNLWALSSGKGEPRIPPFLSLLAGTATDACQLDDFIVGVTSAVLVKAGARVEIWSGDGRFRTAAIELPRIRYPFYLVLQTHEHRVGIPVYQRDSEALYQALNNTANPDYITPYRIDNVPIWQQYMDTKRKMSERQDQWRRSKAARPPAKIPSVNLSRPFMESPVAELEESSYEDPVTPEEHTFLQTHAFDGVEDGGDPDCAHVMDPPTMSILTREELQRLASYAVEASRGRSRR